MKIWEEHDYDTDNPEKWVELMNLSTAEWNVGPFPAHVVATSGSFEAYTAMNSSSTAASANYTTLVIPFTGRDKLGTAKTEDVVFGVVSGLVILAVAIWLWFQRKALLGPRQEQSAGAKTGDSTSSVTQVASGNDGGDLLTEADFRRKLLNFYYEPETTQLEPYEKDNWQDDDLTAEDLEAAQELVRKMYHLDLQLWSSESSTTITERKREEMRRRSDALLAEVRRTAKWWNSRRDELGVIPGSNEAADLDNIVQILMYHIPHKRYASTIQA